MDVSALEGKLRKLDQSLSTLASSKHAEQLLSIVHRPGWTTVAEAALVTAMIDALQHHVDGLHAAHQSLLNAAGKVGHT